MSCLDLPDSLNLPGSGLCSVCASLAFVLLPPTRPSLFPLGTLASNHAHSHCRIILPSRLRSMSSPVCFQRRFVCAPRRAPSVFHVALSRCQMAHSIHDQRHTQFTFTARSIHVQWRALSRRPMALCAGLKMCLVRVNQTAHKDLLGLCTLSMSKFPPHPTVLGLECAHNARQHGVRMVFWLGMSESRVRMPYLMLFCRCVSHCTWEFHYIFFIFFLCTWRKNGEQTRVNIRLASSRPRYWTSARALAPNEAFQFRVRDLRRSPATAFADLCPARSEPPSIELLRTFHSTTGVAGLKSFWKFNRCLGTA
jgi:hypothetical protein